MKNLVDVVNASQNPQFAVADRLASYHRSLSLAFERIAPEGVTRINGRLEGDGPHSIPDPVVKFEVWLLDSMLWTIEELVAGRAVYALRGLVQVAGYRGRLEGLGKPNHSTSDAFLVVKNYVEEIIAKGESK